MEKTSGINNCCNNLDETEKENWKKWMLSTAFYVRESLKNGILIPKDSNPQTSKRLEQVISTFEAINIECEESGLVDDPYFCPYKCHEIKDKTNSLRIIKNS